MTTTLWLILAVLLVPVGWFVLKTIIAFSVPQSVTGTLLFKQELKKRNIPYQHLPPEFFAECVAWAERLSAFTGHGTVVKQKAEFVESLINLANMVELWRTEPNSPMFNQPNPSPSSYRSMFEKYDLRKAL